MPAHERRSQRGGALSPIGPTFTGSTDGCPFDLAIRAGDARIWAVLQGGGFMGGASVQDEKAAAGEEPSVAAPTPSPMLVTIDPTTGLRTPVGPLGFGFPAASSGGALAFDAAGTLWYFGITGDPQCVPGPDAFPDTSGQCLYQLDPSTGHATFVATGPTPFKQPDGSPTIVWGGTASCDSVLATLLTAQPAQPPVGALNTVDTTTGALTARPTSYGAAQVNGIEVDDATGTLWGIGHVGFALGDAAATFTIDPVTGAPTKVADLTIGANDVLEGLAIAGLTCAVETVEIAPRLTG